MRYYGFHNSCSASPTGGSRDPLWSCSIFLHIAVLVHLSSIVICLLSFCVSSLEEPDVFQTMKNETEWNWSRAQNNIWQSLSETERSAHVSSCVRLQRCCSGKGRFCIIFLSFSSDDTTCKYPRTGFTVDTHAVDNSQTVQREAGHTRTKIMCV